MTKASLYEEYLAESFNGLDPKDIVFSMSVSDPDSGAATQVISEQVRTKDGVLGRFSISC